MEDTLRVAAPKEVRNDVLVKAKEMVVNLETENLSLRSDPVAKRSAQGRASMDNIWWKQGSKGAIEEKEEAVWLLPVEKTKRENSQLIKQLNKDVLTATIKLAEEIGALAASPVQAVRKIGELKKEGEVATQKLGGICKDEKPVECERDGMQAKLQLAQHERKSW